MIHIAIYSVTFNSYKTLYEYYESIKKATSDCNKEVFIDFFVADNTETAFQHIDLQSLENLHPHIFEYHENLGYFGAIHQMMKETVPEKYEYVILSNVDVIVNKLAIDRLCHTVFSDQIGWIAPQIFSLKEKRDLNPAIINRYSQNKLKVLRLLYKHPFLLWLYEKTLYKRKKIKSNNVKITDKEIYAGHGSFIILTKEFIKKCGIINYPIFLYDEELYLAEECRSHKLKVIHEPSIIIEDIGKVSTGKLPSNFYCKYNEEGINYILNTYYQ